MSYRGDPEYQRRGGGWIGVDLDGTLAHSNCAWKNGEIGPPVPLMVARVRKWLAEGEDVRIVTARADLAAHTAAEITRTLHNIENWCVKHLGQVLPVRCSKDPRMLALYDDRAIQVERDTGRLIGADDRAFNHADL